MPDIKARQVLAASLLLSAVLGSIHAFSIFIAPLEQRFAAGRGDISLAYSLALLTVTLGVLLGDRVYRRLAPPYLALAIGLAAGAGLAAAAQASAVWQLWAGYSGLFGLANGLGYGLALHAAGQAHPGREGRMMGLVTAAYALGAAATPFALEPLLSPAGVSEALLALGGAMLVAGLLTAAWFASSGFAFRPASASGAAAPAPGRRSLALLWACYGAAVAAGLMAIGHASEIARSQGASERWALAAPTLLALANIAGSVAGGLLADRRRIVAVLGGLPLLTGAGLLGLGLVPGAAAALAGLALTGFAYGATIAAYPAAVVRLYGAARAVRAYGIVFTAWGAAGFLAPWCAGLLFDATGAYRLPLVVAALLAFLSTGLVLLGRARLSAVRSDPA